ncbi:siderophore-interacting protein [Agaribacterium sp. ZY112]|uniref:siderophore-interacting protein n=1 Tax=Agaribacterium sp. ZY112 TaxID=3233574 RepID=UPI003523C363
MRMTHVVRIEDLSPHMRRIVVGGEALEDFPLGQEGAHVKAVFPKPGEKEPKLGLMLGAKKWMRSYTIRTFDEHKQELSLDFAVNDHRGLATDWASQAQIGDLLGIAGPGPTKYTNYQAHWHLIVADLTALPAAAAALEKLPTNAKGYALIQVPTTADIQPLKKPKGIELNWVIGPYQHKNLLLEKVQQVEWLNEEPAIFIAAESAQMQEIKLYIKTKPGYQKKLTYASGYWKA